MHTRVILLNAYTCDSVKCIRVILLMHTCVILLNDSICGILLNMHVILLNAYSVKYIVILLNAYMCDSVKCIHV